MNEKVNNFVKAVGQLLVDLAERWLDESQYEDINEYQKVIQKTADKFGIQLTGMNRRPFGCRFREGSRIYTIEVRFKGSRVSVMLSAVEA